MIFKFLAIDCVDTYIYLYNSSEVLLKENDDIGNKVNNNSRYLSRIKFDCISSEIYYIAVEGRMKGYITGRYSISVKPFYIEQTAYLKNVSITPDSIIAPGTAIFNVNILMIKAQLIIGIMSWWKCRKTLLLISVQQHPILIPKDRY